MTPMLLVHGQLPCNYSRTNYRLHLVRTSASEEGGILISLKMATGYSPHQPADFSKPADNAAG